MSAQVASVDLEIRNWAPLAKQATVPGCLNNECNQYF